MEKDFFDVPDPLWRRIEPLLPPELPKPKGGRPRVPDRVAMAGILYRVRTGCQWKALPPDFGSGSTCHLRMMQWVRAGIFARIHEELLVHYPGDQSADEDIGRIADCTCRMKNRSRDLRCGAR